MNDLEISKALALAIGWPKVSEHCLIVQVAEFGVWRIFDYRDWNVIGPIAERYDAFPMRSVKHDEWHASYNGNDLDFVYADTAQKAIALAVIQGVKK